MYKRIPPLFIEEVLVGFIKCQVNTYCWLEVVTLTVVPVAIT